MDKNPTISFDFLHIMSANLSKYWTPVNFFYYSFFASNLIHLWDIYLHYRQVSFKGCFCYNIINFSF